MEKLKVVLYLCATVVMGGVIFAAPAVADTVAIFYVSILSTYLGLDVWGMIKNTSLLPPGEYKKVKTWRYVLCAVSYILLITCGYVQTALYGANFDGMFSVFISAVFILIALLIGGLEGNKIATGTQSTTNVSNDGCTI